MYSSSLTIRVWGTSSTTKERRPSVCTALASVWSSICSSASGDAKATNLHNHTTTPANLLCEMEQAQELEKIKPAMKEEPAVVEEDRGPRPHRCNDRLEDFVQALFEGDLRKNLPGPAKLFWRCYTSKPGEEPTDPFFYLEEDANGKLVPKGRR